MNRKEQIRAFAVRHGRPLLKRDELVCAARQDDLGARHLLKKRLGV